MPITVSSVVRSPRLRDRVAATTGTLLLCMVLTSMSAIPAQAVERKADPDLDCPAGLVCFSPSEYSEIAKKLAKAKKLEAERLSRFGLGITCGPTAYLQVEQGEVTVDGALGCSVGLTIRF